MRWWFLWAGLTWGLGALAAEPGELEGLSDPGKQAAKIEFMHSVRAIWGARDAIRAAGHEVALDSLEDGELHASKRPLDGAPGHTIWWRLDIDITESLQAVLHVEPFVHRGEALVEPDDPAVRQAVENARKRLMLELAIRGNAPKRCCDEQPPSLQEMGMGWAVGPGYGQPEPAIEEQLSAEQTWTLLRDTRWRLLAAPGHIRPVILDDLFSDPAISEPTVHAILRLSAEEGAELKRVRAAIAAGEREAKTLDPVKLNGLKKQAFVEFSERELKTIYGEQSRALPVRVGAKEANLVTLDTSRDPWVPMGMRVYLLSPEHGVIHDRMGTTQIFWRASGE